MFSETLIKKELFGTILTFKNSSRGWLLMDAGVTLKVLLSIELSVTFLAFEPFGNFLMQYHMSNHVASLAEGSATIFAGMSC